MARGRLSVVSEVVSLEVNVMKPSISQSEEHGIAALKPSDLRVLSIGVSTGGKAEIRMARASTKRHIVATSLDAEGIQSAQKKIAHAGLNSQITLKLEDVRTLPLPYEGDYFDYIYARLVLHYLSKQELEGTLKELHRVLKPAGRIYIVVRSTECDNAKMSDNTYDRKTGITSGSFISAETGELYTFRRYFHTEESISDFIVQAGLQVSYVTSYDETLFVDFMHTQKTSKSDNVIELLASK